MLIVYVDVFFVMGANDGLLDLFDDFSRAQVLVVLHPGEEGLKWKVIRSLSIEIYVKCIITSTYSFNCFTFHRLPDLSYNKRPTCYFD